MSGRVVDATPLRAPAAVVLLWVLGRAAVLAGWQPAGAPAEAQLGERRTPPVSRLAASPVPLRAIARPRLMLVDWRPRLVSPDGQAVAAPVRAPSGTPPTPASARRLAAAAPPAPQLSTPAAGILAPAKVAAVAAHRSRLSGSAWAFVRGGGRATSLSPGGQIGGGQTGLRILYRFDDSGRIAAAGRLSTTIGGIRQSEAAIGIDVKPIASLPVHFMAERRIALDSGGRNAWTLGAAGGAYAVPLGRAWRLDGYGEAGVVGIHRRDLYADGAVRIARAITFGSGPSLALGGGVWAAAQPGVSRVDVGPSAVLRLPVEGRTIALALDWRQQIAGRARPHSGVAFTAGVDF